MEASDSPSWLIRGATAADIDAVLQLIRDLAEAVGSREDVVADAASLNSSLFKSNPLFYVLVAEMEGRIVGLASWFKTFSTWLGRPGIYLDDLYLAPEARHLGIGTALLQELARIAVQCGCRRLEWTVVESNTRAQEFYRRHGGQPLEESRQWRLAGEALVGLARRRDETS